MFTGLIEEIGTIKKLIKENNSIYMTICCSNVLNDIKIGDSIAVNGACQTVIDFDNTGFTIFASSETISKTTFDKFFTGLNVNLERALRLGDRIGGHIVSGHVDGIAKISDIKQSGETIEIYYQTTQELSKQIVKKGSITIDGISLTIADTNALTFCVAVIPHTFESTNLKERKIGDLVNIETDLLAKYVEKYLQSNNNKSNIDINLLERNGFL